MTHFEQLEDHEETGSDPDSPVSSDAESQLQQNREILRQRLAQETNGKGFGETDGFAGIAAPLARQFVRDHPYASLSGAALAGVWLVRGKPWRALGGSLVAGLLARQALALSLSSGSHLLKGWFAGVRSRQAPNRMP